MSRAKVRGFTLLELMVVVAVMAILAALAYNAYGNQVRKSRRAEAKQVLTDLVLKQEKYRSNHPAYGTTIAAIGGANSSSWYTIAVVGTPDATTYTMTATPTGDQTKDSCGTLQVAMSAGTLSKTPTTSGCWN